MSAGKIQVANRQTQFKIRASAVASFCVAAMRSLDHGAAALSVVFVGPRKMRSINKTYLQHDYATDVLSFSYKGSVTDDESFLGEIIIAPEVAAGNAIRYGTNLEKELRKLLVHGILHLLGYNHETDGGQMNRLQARVLRSRLLIKTCSLVDIKRIE